jgi:alpha-tubulin suppressor-like RCC1 family protein
MHRPGIVVPVSVALLAAASALAQDECSTAFFISSLPASRTLSTATLTASANPPTSVAGSCDFLQWTPTTKDGWYQFEITEPSLLTVSLCSSNFDTSLVLYRGTCSTLTRVACDDDDCQPSGPGYQSRLVDTLVWPGRHYIRIGGYNGASGTVTVNVSRKPVRGDVSAWGAYSLGQLAVPNDVIGITGIDAADNTTYALMQDRTVRAWGLTSLFGYNLLPPAGLTGVRQVAASGDHALAVTSNDIVTCWGDNFYGQSTPPAGLSSVMAIGAGEDHSLAVKFDGTVVCWGRNDFGQCNVPSGSGPFSQVDGGGFHSMALSAAGTVVCWGGNSDGQSTVPAGLGLVSSVSAYGAHSVAVLASGGVSCWGRNSSGQCNVPAGLSGVVQASAGTYHTLALKADGTVVAWGGVGAVGNSGQAIVPAGLSRVRAVAAGDTFSLALSEPDCDANGTNDYLELSGHDCDGNGRHDCRDNDLGFIEDCNGNGYGDSCEKQLFVTATSPQLGPIGALQPRVFSIAGAVPALEPDVVTVRVKGRGDFGGDLESVRVRIGTAFDRTALAGTADCLDPAGWQSFTMSATDFNASFEPDGSLKVRLDPSVAVDHALCPGGSWVQVQLEYLGAASTDCNLNGLLDGCEIAAGLAPDTNSNGIPDACDNPIINCPTDFDANLATDGSDLAYLLGAWGTAAAAFDLDDDGIVNGADLAVLLGAWGPCVN